MVNGSLDHTGLLKTGQGSDFSLKSVSVLKEQDFLKFLKLGLGCFGFPPFSPFPVFASCPIQICVFCIVSMTEEESLYLLGPHSMPGGPHSMLRPWFSLSSQGL